MKSISPIELEIFKNLFNSLCEEMGVVLCRSSFSPNIKERRDFSCALFDAQARLVAQAAHIPVHLGSMALSVKAAVKAFRLRAGDSVILNDPYQGGTHLPDITLVSPVFVGSRKTPAFYVANRAHHADVGGKSPGSMALASHLKEEGVVISPTLFTQRGKINQKFLKSFLKQVRKPEERRADLKAQAFTNEIGIGRMRDLANQYGLSKIQKAMMEFRRYEERLTREALQKIPKGIYSFQDAMDDDGFTKTLVWIAADIRTGGKSVLVDFSRSQDQVQGPVNATDAITYSAVAYVFRCLVTSLMGEEVFSMNPIEVITRKGSVVDAAYPAPVAGGNVETSQRIVDVLLGALAKALPSLIPAASQGTMNNLAFGSEKFTYYETLAGGMGGSPTRKGENAMHSHMTNTLNTPLETLETTLPLRVTQYRIRNGSGGKGLQTGGNGLIREYEFLEEAEVSILSDRRRRSPYGLKGGRPGKVGINFLISNGKTKRLPGKCELTVKKGDRIRIETPGGGGWGKI